LASGSKRKFIADQYVIRQKLGGLRSSLFVFDPIVGGAGEIEKLIIYGGASGHGVGMSQVGAIGRAEHGQKYPEILKAYYPTTRLTLLSQIALQYGEKGARR
jgi:SpoIID/LytB domain protein